jgi:hypothetical protein
VRRSASRGPQIPPPRISYLTCPHENRISYLTCPHENIPTGIGRLMTFPHPAGHLSPARNASDRVPFAERYLTCPQQKASSVASFTRISSNGPFVDISCSIGRTTLSYELRQSGPSPTSYRLILFLAHSRPTIIILLSQRRSTPDDFLFDLSPAEHSISRVRLQGSRISAAFRDAYVRRSASRGPQIAPPQDILFDLSPRI